MIYIPSKSNVTKIPVPDVRPPLDTNRGSLNCRVPAERASLIRPANYGRRPRLCNLEPNQWRLLPVTANRPSPPQSPVENQKRKVQVRCIL